MAADATRPDIPAATRRWHRKPSAPVDAIQWTGANFAAVKDFASGALGIGEVEDGALPLWVVKSKAVCNVQRGDWIIREADGDGFYPCAADVFAATYEAATITPVPSETATGPAEGIWRDRAEAAEAKLAEVRRTIAAFFTHHGGSATFALQSARDLAEGIRQVLDRAGLEALEGAGTEPAP